jgi:hypothetical protein
MKYTGVIILLLASWWAYAWRHDPVEGRFMVPFGVIVAIIGVCMYFEGLKCEIIEALKDSSKKQ